VLELPHRYRAAIDLHYFAGLSHRDIGKALGMQEDAVAKRMQRARECLRSLLQRRGVTVTGALVVLALNSAPADAAPATLTAKVSAAAHAALSASTISTSLAVPVVGSFSGKIIVIALASALVSGGAWWGIHAATHEKSASITTSELQLFTFDNAGEEQRLSVVKGSWKRLPDAGNAGTGCMETSIDFYLELPIDRKDLPVQVSCKLKGIYPSQYHQVGFNQARSPVFILGLDEGIDVEDTSKHQRWVDKITYVTDEYVCEFIDQQMTRLYFAQTSASTDKLVMSTYRGFTIDDLEIRHASKLPNIDRFKEALDRIPDSQRHGTVTDSGLTSSVTGKDLRILFMDTDGRMFPGLTER
jgi:hypothetical protein